jgi:hypothetical protein
VGRLADERKGQLRAHCSAILRIFLNERGGISKALRSSTISTTPNGTRRSNNSQRRRE